MSIWQCQSCGTLTGPNPGACPKCGAATRYWHGLSYGETNTDLTYTVEPSVDEVAQLKAENARLRAETTRLQGELDRLTREHAEMTGKLDAAEQHVKILRQQAFEEDRDYALQAADIERKAVSDTLDRVAAMVKAKFTIGSEDMLAELSALRPKATCVYGHVERAVGCEACARRL